VDYKQKMEAKRAAQKAARDAKKLVAAAQVQVKKHFRGLNILLFRIQIQNSTWGHFKMKTR
jgi:hypothetical protein